MENSKDELIQKIELARLVLNKSIDENQNYDEIYKNSVELDRLIEEYIIAGY
ncbi:MAG: Spo0E family sporulation regulatory protein-aspartic acid phosphatase [Hungatella sp.]|nr:Spo0E family sporulation regulatory protein-aspartic acid phosphatase [Hungatella sp.]